MTDTDTATALGSGDVPVLATPRLIAWMEAATVRAATAFLETGQTTVGTAIRIEHRRATPVGGSVEITVTPPRDVAGSRLTFVVQAVDGWDESSRPARSTGRSSTGNASSRQCQRWDADHVNRRRSMLLIHSPTSILLSTSGA